jgi:riboflavin synthase alpha subunit
MKVILRLAAVVTLISAVQMVRAADVTGTWKGAFDFQGNSIALTLNLKSDGKTLTGTIEGLPTTPAEIHDGVVTGDAVTFWVNSDYQGTMYKLVYKGKVTADQIVFDFGTEDGSWSSPLTVKKGGEDAAKAAAPVPPPPPASADVDGNWKGSFDLNGSDVPVTFHLKKAAGAVTGTIDGMGPAPVEIHEGKVEGDTLTFWVNTDYQGQTYTLMYKGKVGADRIDFTFGTVDGAWGSAVSAKKAS